MGQALSRMRLRSSEEVLDWCSTVISTTHAAAEYMGPRMTLVAVCDLNSNSRKPEESGRAGERESGRQGDEYMEPWMSSKKVPLESFGQL